MKIISYIKENFLFIITLFLLAFIPLYPKIPLLGISHTWVYIRLEDVLIALAYIIFGIQFLRRKVTLKTPLTFPIFLFWGIGALSTILALIFIFPNLRDVFPKIALFFYLRHIEYLGLFFIAFASVREKKMVPIIVTVLTMTLLAVVFYGLGQRMWGFPAFLTMNEEFAKGIPLRLSAASRIPSTFGGHYDLAAYLVMLIPILGSLVFGFKKWYVKIILAGSAFLGLVLLLMTESRTSFFVYLITIIFMLVLQKRKWFIIPIFIVSMLTLNSFQGLSERFGSTITSADVVYDARTGQAVGIAKEVTEDGKTTLVIEDVQSTGENLPQGSSYINLPNQEPSASASSVTYKRNTLKDGVNSTEIRNIEGDFIVRKSLSIDISATTRFQGQWPRAIDAFKRNYLLGSGYSSISLATDGNYVRMLGEIGILGLFSFVLIFIFLGIYAYRVLPHVDSKPTRSLVYGVLAGIFGLSLNAILIDVFEASKVAYVLWLLVGLTVGLLHLYQKEKVDFVQEVKVVLLSIPALCLYLFTGACVVFYMIINNFFVGDDFTWLHWMAEAPSILGPNGGFSPSNIAFDQIGAAIFSFFTDSQGFFYRPGTKVFFYLTYFLGQFNPFLYHLISILLHGVITCMLFILGTRILQSRLFGAIAASLFLVLSIHFEAIFWISSVGHLLTSFFMVASLMLFIYWKEKKHWLLLVLSLVAGFAAPLFHEFGAFLPLLIIGYDLVKLGVSMKAIKERWYYLVYLCEIPLYYVMRSSAQSAWFEGDYSYNLLKFPLNFFGNILGYFGISVFGTRVLSFISMLREVSRDQIWLVSLLLILFVGCLVFLILLGRKKLSSTDKKVIGTSLVLYLVPLLPFLGLGNISPRYVYLASFGVILLITFALQKMFLTIYKSQKILSYVLLLVIIPFMYLNILDLQRIDKDWEFAGNITNNMMAKIGLNYKSSKSQVLPPNPIFYFTNVPIRYGDAWVFPVGLPDAIWFVFQQENVTVKQLPTAEDAIMEAKNAPGKIFQFTPQGDIEEIIAL